MPRAVLDTTILVSAFLKPVSGGASFDVLRLAHDGAFDLFLSAEILEEAARVLLTAARIRRRYAYDDADVAQYCANLSRLGRIVKHLPDLRVVRDPEDDMILATAIAAKANFLVTRDEDLLSLESYEGIAIVTPEKFLHRLRPGRTS